LYEGLQNFPGICRRLDCKGLLFTNYECRQPDSKEKFFIECNYIAYVLSGRRIFHKDQESWELKEGTCVFVKKGTHVAEKPEGEGWCVMAFFIPDTFLKQLINDNRKSLPMANLPDARLEHVLPLDVNDLSKSFFMSMLPYFKQVPPPPENLIELKFKELVLSLLSNINNSRLLSWLNNLCNEKYPTLDEIMQNNYTFNLTSEQYAKLAHMSLSTFKREFKKIFKESPAKWITKNRLKRAAELLENTSLSVSEVGFECGFENQTHFSRVFKEKMSLSPLQFRMSFQSA